MHYCRWLECICICASCIYSSSAAVSDLTASSSPRRTSSLYCIWEWWAATWGVRGVWSLDCVARKAHYFWTAILYLMLLVAKSDVPRCWVSMKAWFSIFLEVPKGPASLCVWNGALWQPGVGDSLALHWDWRGPNALAAVLTDWGPGLVAWVRDAEGL